MLYQRPSFQLPAAGLNTTEKNWDRAFLTQEQFESKYGQDEFYASVPQADGFTE